MLPHQEQKEVTPAEALEQRPLLTGDLGVVVVRALVENGVGYVVSSWQDRPTPIDAAIDASRERVLSPRGVVLRRLRSLSALEPIVTAPAGGITGQPPRGAVIFAGRNGLRPALEQFLAVRSSGAVVGFTFDEDASRIEDALVIDPDPTAIGLVRAIDAAFAASIRCGRPALIVLRERALGMRGTIRQRAERTPDEAAAADHELREPLGEQGMSPAAAAAAVGLVTALQGAAPSARSQTPARVVLASGPMRATVERALAQLAAATAPSTIAAAIDDVALVSSNVLGILPDAGEGAGALLAAAERVCIIAPRAARLAERIDATDVTAHAVNPGTVQGEQVARVLLDWLRADPRLAEAADAGQVFDAAAAALDGAIDTSDVRTRIPRRSELLHRGVSPVVAAGLTLAQGVIGVPSRIDVAFPTYMTDTGVPLSVVPAEVFAAHGTASAAPGSAAGVFVVTGQAGGVAEAAGAGGASIEHVDGGSPRAIAVAIAKACRSARASSHVIVVTDVQRVAAPRRAAFGMDPDLAGTERIATAVLPVSAAALVDLGDELLAGPSTIALDRPEAHAALPQLRELSPATWDLTHGPSQMGRAARMRWNLRRRVIRAATGVDL